MAASFWLLVFSCLLCGCILFGAHSQEEDTCSKKEVLMSQCNLSFLLKVEASHEMCVGVVHI